MGTSEAEGVSGATGYLGSNERSCVGRYLFWAKKRRGGEVPVIPADVPGKSKPYCELGKLLDTLARDRDVRGPYNLASYLENATSYDVSGQAISKYLYGKA